MKRIIATILLISITMNVFSQTKEENIVKDLSAKIFKWEIAGQIDSLNNVFHDKLQVWGTSGPSVNKIEYLQRLSSPNFIHNNVTIENSTAIIANNTSIVNGDGIFNLTISGNKTTLHLSYIEVFTRPDASKPWVLLSINAKQKTD